MKAKFNINIKYLLIGLCLAGLLGGVLVSPGQAQQGQGATLGPQDAVRSLAYAVTCFDALLLDNDGMITGTIQNESFTLDLEGGGSRSFTREEIDTILLATPTTGRLKDRVILRSGEIFQGKLHLESFQVRLASGEEIALPKARVQGAVLATTKGGACIGEGFIPPDEDEVIKTIVRLINNSLTPGLVGSLSKYDWVLLTNLGILSGTVCDEEFSLDAMVLPKDDLVAILFIHRADIAIVVLKLGEWLEGKLAGTKLCLAPVYQEGQTQLAHETLRGVIFRAILSGGGPGG